jgi:hypothetical protein
MGRKAQQQSRAGGGNQIYDAQVHSSSERRRSSKDTPGQFYHAVGNRCLSTVDSLQKEDYSPRQKIAPHHQEISP